MKHNVNSGESTNTKEVDLPDADGQNVDVAATAKKKNTRKGILFAFIAAASFSIIPIMATLGHANNMPISTLLFYRFALAFCSFALYCLISRKRLRLAKKDYKYIAAASIMYCGQTFCFFSCFQFISPAVGEMIFSVNPILVLAFGFIFFKMGVSRNKLLASLLAIAGAAFVVYAPSDLPVRPQGVIFALMASSCCAIYILINKRFNSHIETPVLTTYLAAGCAVVFFVMSVAGKTMILPTDRTLIVYILILAFFSTILGFFCFLKSVSLLNPGLVSIIGLSEPIFTIVLAYFIFGHMLTLWQIVGSAILLFSIYRFEKTT